MTTTEPTRVQRKRTKGWRLQTVSHELNGLPAKLVTRPGIWGNPFRADVYGLDLCLALYRQSVEGGWDPSLVTHLNYAEVSEVCRLHRAFIDNFLIRCNSTPRGCLIELRGFNLCCACPLDRRCHAEILIELANGSA